MNRAFHLTAVLAGLALTASTLAATDTAGAATSPARAAGSGRITAAAATTHGAHQQTARLGSRVGRVTIPDHTGAMRAGIRAGRGGPQQPKATTSNLNWSGMVGFGTFQGVYSTWTQPAITATAANHYGSTWVGVDGAGNKNLIQTGTEADDKNGKVVYRAWEEILPAQPTEQVIVNTSTGAPVPVRPGDAMRGEVVETATAGVWMIYLQDVTQNWYYQQNWYYSGGGTSAEWIEEASTYNNTIVAPPNFGTVRFSNMELAQNGSWYRTAFTSAYGYQIVQNGHVWATPGAPTGSPYQSFNVTYHG